MPEGFPNIELRHRYTIAAPGSGSFFLDNVFFRELPAPSDPHWIDLVSFGAAWSYTVEPAARDWYREGFDFSNWPVAQAKFGGGTGVRGVITPLPLMRPAYYFRREFLLADPRVDELLLAARATDNFNGKSYPLRVYLNGQEFLSSGIDTVSGSGNTVQYFDLLPFSDLLRPGTNTLAVMLQNGWASDWDNVGFDLALKAVPSRSPSASAQFKSIRPDPDGSVSLSIAGLTNSSWALECSEDFSVARAWRRVRSLIIGPDGTAAVIHRPGGGGSTASNGGVRFYRLVAE
jgi:hypothetical protein